MAELILKFDLNDALSREKFNAILNAYNYKNLFAEFKAKLDELDAQLLTASDGLIRDEISTSFYLLSSKYGLL